MTVLDGVYKTPGMASSVARDLVESLNVKDNPTIGYFVDGRMVGFLSGYRYKNDEKAARIRYLYVHKMYRKKFGIGRMLVDEFGKVMKVNGVECLRAEMALRAYNSAEFYKKCGFQQVGISVNFLEKTL